MDNCGIYRIDVNGYVYIGSSIHLLRRWRDHKRSLRLHTHTNKRLQRIYDKYGLDSIKFKVLETCDKKYLLEVEQHYLNEYKLLYRNNMLNMCLVAGNKLGTQLSDESKKKISIANTGRTRSNETKLLLSEISKTRKQSDSKKLKTSIRMMGNTYAPRKIIPRLLSPDGTLYTNIVGIKTFAREHGLGAERLRHLVRGDIQSYRGWIIPKGVN